MGTPPEKLRSTQLSVSFPGISGRQAGELAASLTEDLRNLDSSLTVSREKRNPDTQDMGTILNIVLGSVPAATIATGLAAFMRKRRIKVRIETAERSIDVAGDGEDAARIIESVFTQK